MFLVLLMSTALLCCCTIIEGRDTTARCMRTKCTVSKLNEELQSMGGADGLVKVLSWNVEGINGGTICKYLAEMDVWVIGLQRVTLSQFYQLQTTCMKNYNVSGVPDNFRSIPSFNPIFYKKDRNIDTEIASGTYSSLTWARLTFQAPTTRHRRGVLSQNLLAILSGKRVQKKYARAIQKKFYRKQLFFVNVDIADKDSSKKKTLYKLLSHLYFNVMERRRHRVILFGTVGWKSSAQMLSRYMRRRRRGSKVYFSMFRRAMTTSSPASKRMKNINNQIWQSNMRSRSFRSVLSAVVHTETKNKPTFSMFLV